MLMLDDIFLSIQGEALDTGLPCVFVRLYGCPIGCVFCDQKQDPNNKRRISVENLVNKVKAFKGIENVCITGGEPMIQADVIPFVWELMHLGYKVSIETSGCVKLPEIGYRRSFKYVMDIKCPCSGVSDKNIYENLIHLQSNDEVKFVIADRRDYDFMKSVLNKYPTSATILVSPMFDENNKSVIGKDLVDWILEDKLKCRVMIQLHKVLNVK